jgi:hypothetical protein
LAAGSSIYMRRIEKQRTAADPEGSELRHIYAHTNGLKNS